jgi:hypothetical protein
MFLQVEYARCFQLMCFFDRCSQIPKLFSKRCHMSSMLHVFDRCTQIVSMYRKRRQVFSNSNMLDVFH